jgi:hypothetical protein
MCASDTLNTVHMCQELRPFMWEKSHSHFVVIAALLPRFQILTSWCPRLSDQEIPPFQFEEKQTILSNESYINNCHGTFESTLKSPPMLYFIGVKSCCCTFSIRISIEVVIEFKNLQLFFSGVTHIIHGSPLQWNFLISHIINCYPSSHIVIWSLPPERRRIKGNFLNF